MKERPFAYCSGLLAKIFAVLLNLRHGLIFIFLLEVNISSYGQQCTPTFTTDYCTPGNGQVQLTATLAGASNFQWNTGATGPSITVPGAGIYTVTFTKTGCISPNNRATVNVGNDLVVNGNFSAGYGADFQSSYNYSAGTNFNPGTFTVNSNPKILNNAFWGIDHTHAIGTASQNFMIIDGSTGINIPVWYESVTVQPNTTYYFSIYAMSLSREGPFAQLSLNVKGTAIKTVNLFPGYSGPTNNDNNTWQHYYASWTSGATVETVTISITDNFIIHWGNDFALDDISFSTLNPFQISASSNSPVCPGNTINLSTRLTGDPGSLTYSWSGPAGFSSGQQNPIRTGASPLMGGIYTVKVTDPANSCTRTASVNVDVTSGTTVTAGASAPSVCPGETVSLNSSATSGPYTATLFSDNFNGNAANWTKRNTGTGGTLANASWTLEPSPYNYRWCDGNINCDATFISNDSTQFYLTNSQAQEGSVTRTELISPAINLNASGYTALTLSFYQSFKGGTGDTAFVEISQNGINWTRVDYYTSSQGYQTTPFNPPFYNKPVIDLTSYRLWPTMYIRFRYYATDDWFWGIDNVSLTGTSSNYTISWLADPAGTISSTTIANPTATPIVTTTYTVTYTPLSGCQATSMPVIVNVKDAPVITTQPHDFSNCTNPATFTVDLLTGVTYQWYESTTGGTPWNNLTNTGSYSGVNTYMLTVNPIAPKNGYYYFCEVKNTATSCKTNSDTVKLTVTSVAPEITSQPSDQRACVGGDATFTVISNGQNFQWQENDGTTGWVNIGTNSPSLNLTNIPVSHSGYQYQCIVTNDCGSITSAFGTLTVNPLPVITAVSDPSPVCPNGSTSFTVGATGGVSYQWQVSTDNGSSWTDITSAGTNPVYAGYTTSTLGLSAIDTSNNGYLYRCSVTDNITTCSSESNSATLTINPAVIITNEPRDQEICQGSDAIFDISATGTGTLHYQWQTYNGSTGIDIPGEINPSLTVANGIDSTRYICVVTDACNQPVTSDIATLIYNLSPVSHLQPRDTTVCADFGVSVSFIVEPILGVEYLWQVKLRGSSTWDTLTTESWGQQLGIRASKLRVWAPDYPGKDGYQYRCILKYKTTLCSYISEAATLSLNETPFFTITTTSGDLLYCEGSSTTLTANITGPEYDYKWFREAVLIPDSTRQSYVVQFPDQGKFSAMVINRETGCFFYRVPDSVVRFILTNDPVDVTIAATATQICNTGTNVIFTALPGHPYDTNGTQLTYQWRRNGVNILNANSVTYNSAALLNGDAISCVMAANVRCADNNPAISDTIIMQVDPVSQVSVTISSDPGSTTICAGTEITFTAHPVNEGASPSYLWKKNGFPVGTNSPTYTDSGLAMSDVITCVLTSSIANCSTGNPATSNSIAFTVTDLNSFNVTGGGCDGGSGLAVGLSGSISGTIYYLVKDDLTDVASISGTGAPFNFPAQAAGVYTVRAESNGCTKMMNGSVTITSPPTISISNLQVCPGSISADLPYAVGSGSPDQYRIDYNPAAEAQGFTDVPNSALTASPIVLTVPAGAAAGSWSATLYVSNIAVPGCESVGYPIIIKILNIEVDGDTPPTSACYATLREAFAAINSGIHQGAVTVKVIRSTNETILGSAILNASGIGSSFYTSVTMYPTSPGLLITGALGQGVTLVDLNGADNVTINGSLNGTGSAAVLTLQNTSTFANAGTSTIKLHNDATNNVITYCNVLGSSTTAALATNGGNIWIGADSPVTGNDNNTISNCNIGPAGGNLPTKCIYLNGSTTVGKENNNIVITNNNIYDYFSPTKPSAGIYSENGNTSCSFTNNNFYQTGSRTQTTGTQHSAIWIANSTGNNFLISGNVIGYSNSIGTGTYTLVGIAGTKFLPIYLNVGNATATSVISNTIAGISISGSCNGTAGSPPFAGIFINNGLVNVGGTAGNPTGNTIGSMAANGSIFYTTNSSSISTLAGIYSSSPDSWITNNNNIGGITASSTGTGEITLTGIRGATGTATWTCSNNKIGGTTANSISNTSTATQSWVDGIYNSSFSANITNNTIRNITASGGSSSATYSAVGIVITTSSVNHTISQNTIYNLSNTNVSGSNDVNGIMFAGSTGPNLVEKNFIYSFTNPSSDNTSTIAGIIAKSGTTTYSNNIVSFGSNTTGAQVIGINDLGGSNSIFHNTVSLTGSTTGASTPDAAIVTIASNYRNIRNNIFANARTGGSGAHNAVNISSLTGLTIEYNDYIGTPLGIVPDINSLTILPAFPNAAGTLLTDYIPGITTLMGTNTLLGIVPKDIDDDNRCIPTMGAQEKTIVPSDLTATATPDPLCAGKTLTLTGTATGATSYSWSGPNSYISDLQSPTIINISTAGAGVYTLTATNCFGSATASTLSVVVNPLPSTSAIYHR